MSGEQKYSNNWSQNAIEEYGRFPWKFSRILRSLINKLASYVQILHEIHPLYITTKHILPSPPIIYKQCKLQMEKPVDRNKYQIKI